MIIPVIIPLFPVVLKLSGALASRYVVSAHKASSQFSVYGGPGVDRFGSPESRGLAGSSSLIHEKELAEAASEIAVLI